MRPQRVAVSKTERLQAAASDTSLVTSPDQSPIVIDRLGRTFDEVVAVEDLSLAVPSGTILGLIGPSGAGKSTVMRVLTGGLLPTSGSACVLGEDTRRLGRRARERIGYMPQLFSLYPELTAAENVDLVASLFGLLFLRRRRRVREVLRLVDLWDARRRRAAALSGGMQRRLELACALVHEPVVLFLDEPTAGVDPLLRGSIWSELRRLRDEAGRTMIVTTQYVGEAEECDAVALVSEGRLVELGRPDDLRRRAVGGDRVEVEADRPIDNQVLAALGSVRGVERLSDRTTRVTVDDAGSAMPSLIAAVESNGSTVRSSREVRPSFDEVFASLVAAHRPSLDAEQSQARGPSMQAGDPGASIG